MTTGIQTISPIDDSVYVQREYASPDAINQALDLARTAQKS